VEQKHQDIYRVEQDGREFIIIGTAHISRESAEIVRQTIESEKPDTVCVELDERRFKALSEQQRWQNLDLKSIIRQKQLSTLILNLILSSYQKRLGEKLGVMPGLELLEATRAAGELSIPVELADRDIRITLRRAWNSMSFWKKMQFMSTGLAGIFEETEISEEQLSEMRKGDALNELLKELGQAMPVLKQVLIDERDQYLAEKIKKAGGRKIVAVVGAGHVQGIISTLQSGQQVDLSSIETIPPVSPVWHWLGWSLPAMILGSILYIGLTQGFSEAGESVLFWILATGIPSAIGSILAAGHIVTTLSAFLAAPLTTLSPLIGVGYVAAFVQAYFSPPLVREFETISKDINHPVMWWKNRLLRVFTVFILSSLGGALGMYVGSYEIISNLF